MRMLGGTGYFGMFACFIIMMGAWFYAVNQKDVPVDQVKLEVKALMPAIAARTIHIQSHETKAIQEELPILGFLTTVHGKEVTATVLLCHVGCLNHFDAGHPRHYADSRQRAGPYLMGTMLADRRYSFLM